MIQNGKDIYIHASTDDEHHAEVSHGGRRSNSRPRPTTMVLTLPPRPLRSDAPAEEKAVVRCLILKAVITQQRLLDLSDTDAFLRAFRVASRLSTAVAAAIAATLMRMMRLE